jgi:hypothetical protein
MNKTLVILIGVLNLFWAVFIVYVLLSFHPDKLYLKGIVLFYPFLLLYTFNSNFINKFSDQIAQKLCIVVYIISMIFAVFFILN